MARTPELLIADVRDEMTKLERLEQSFTATVNPMLKQPPEQVSDYDRGAIGYQLHNFYNGCENIFRGIAAYFENDIGTDRWHADLLRRMRLDIPGHRPAVIDDELYQLLNDFRGFRHVFRSAYSFELDWERERLVAGRLPRAAGLLRQQVSDFLDWVQGLEADS
ncbi:antitoxin [Thiohalocapsa halophila]|uniref:Antitoxin n=1 Tax=Thiohalocapsa halophila TaxID=69359 RepID=A0ABS1CMU4_9GAMM|nr:antitoxin [Thiohalocapsa halophila]MBK1633013.1 antitoxin [Thiohalocapsa halophila]